MWSPSQEYVFNRASFDSHRCLPDIWFEVSKLTSQKLELLEENDVLDDGYVIPRPAPNASLQDILPAELVILLTTLSLTPEEFEQRRSKSKLPKPAMETNQASLLFKILQTKQAQYGSSLAEDMQLLRSLLPPNAPASLDGSARRHKMALQVRIGEKEVLQAILAMLQSLVSGGSLKRSANGDTDTRNFKSARV
jgi:SET domain-containing protein 6